MLQLDVNKFIELSKGQEFGYVCVYTHPDRQQVARWNFTESDPDKEKKTDYAKGNSKMNKEVEAWFSNHREPFELRCRKGNNFPESSECVYLVSPLGNASTVNGHTMQSSFSGESEKEMKTRLEGEIKADIKRDSYVKDLEKNAERNKKFVNQMSDAIMGIVGTLMEGEKFNFNMGGSEGSKDPRGKSAPVDVEYEEVTDEDKPEEKTEEETKTKTRSGDPRSKNGSDSAGDEDQAKAEKIKQSAQQWGAALEQVMRVDGMSPEILTKIALKMQDDPTMLNKLKMFIG